MKITFNLEPRDLRAVRRWALKNLPGSRRVRYFSFAWIIGLSAYAVFVKGGPDAANKRGLQIFSFFLCILLAWATYKLALALVMRISEWRAFTSDKYKSVLCEHTIELRDDSILETTAVNESKHHWNGVYRVVDAPDHIYIFTSADSAIVVPKRAFGSPESARQFCERAIELCAAAKLPRAA